MIENDTNKDYELNGDFWVVELTRTVKKLYDTLEEKEKEILWLKNNCEYKKNHLNKVIDFLLEHIYLTGSKEFGWWEQTDYKDFVRCSNCGEEQLLKPWCKKCGSINCVQDYVLIKDQPWLKDRMKEIELAKKENGVEGEE